MCVALAACGGDDGGGGGGNPDAPGSGSADAPAATVVEVNPCPATPDATVITQNFDYSPKMTTISQGQVVQFMLESSHDVAPLPPMTDSGLRVGFGQTKCLRFTQAGTFNFKCTPHSFTGSIIVN